jgi:hypothetical protein
MKQLVCITAAAMQTALSALRYTPAMSNRIRASSAHTGPFLNSANSARILIRKFGRPAPRSLWAPRARPLGKTAGALVGNSCRHAISISQILWFRT